MSSVYQPKRKELAKVKVVSTEDYKNNRSKLRFIGSVSRQHSNFVTTKRNSKTGKSTFIDDLTFTHKTEEGKECDYEMLKHNSDPEVKNKEDKSYVNKKYGLSDVSSLRAPDKKYRIHQDDIETVKKYKK